jgi:hypothetical protein
MRSSAQAAEGLQRRPTLKRASSDGLGSVQGACDASVKNARVISGLAVHVQVLRAG